MEELIYDNLQEEEQILWQGRPNPNKLFTKFDMFYFPITLLWCVAIAFFGYLIVKASSEFDLTYIYIIFIIFTAMGLYLLVGRFLYKKARRKSIYYYITNKRAIILNKDSIKFENLENIKGIHKDQLKDGSGTLTFGKDLGTNLYMIDMGLTYLAKFHVGEIPIIFFDIPDIDTVFSIAQKAYDQIVK